MLDTPRNTWLMEEYNKMHKQGKTAWFDDGAEERQTIIEMGNPWQGKRVLEIGCGEGELLVMIDQKHATCTGIDYSLEAITTAKNRFPYLDVMCCDWSEYPKRSFDVVVMQGVLEHMDDWQESLDGIIEAFKPETIITSMPSFLNVRGIIWHTLDMLGAVMSKTDLHFIDPWEVKEFCCIRYDGEFQCKHIDSDWGNGKKMIDDLRQRIPLAVRDGGMFIDEYRLDEFLVWLENIAPSFRTEGGAVTVYRIDL